MTNRHQKPRWVRIAIALGATALFSVGVIGMAGKAHAALYNASNELGQYATGPFQPIGWPDYGGDGISDTNADNSNIPNPFGMDFPDSTAIDLVNHRLFVADASNFRVLIYQLDSNNSFATGTPALVLGQADLSSDPDEGGTVNDQELNFPQGLAYDPTTDRLYVSDGNARVLVFDATPGTITNNAHAVHELGQVDMFSQASVTTQAGMWNPVELAIDTAGQRLFVADSANQRVTVYNVATSTIFDGEPAVHELGQPDFNTKNPGGVSQTRFNNPLGLAYDQATGRLFVGDDRNNRVMIFDAASSTMFDDEPAIHILGATTYNTNNGGGSLSQTGLDGPFGLGIDPVNKRLFVGDDFNNRIMVFNIATSTFTDGEAALNELGQPDFNNERNGETDQNTIWDPEGNMAYDPVSGNLFVPDEANNRILEFDASAGTITNGEDAKSVVGQYSYLYSATGGPVYTTNDINNGLGNNDRDAVGFNFQTSPPNGVSIDTVNHRLFVADSNNDRILVFQLDNNDQISSPMPTHVIGQSDYHSRGEFPSQRRISEPTGVTYDPVTSRLFVIDGDNRVYVYDVSTGSIQDGEKAENVLGQPNYTSLNASTSQSGIYTFGGGLIYDPTTQRLFVADTNNSRVMVFNAGTSTIVNNENAAFELGQPDFFSSDATTTQNGLSFPSSLAYDAATQRLFVGDGPNRVMVFNVATSTISNGEPASFVLGQPNFFTSDYNSTSTTRDGLNDVEGLAFSSSTNQLFVSDHFGGRIMVFNVATSTIATKENADNVLGAPDFTSVTYDVTQNNMDHPSGLGFDPVSNQLFIIDQFNDRVLQYSFVNISNASLAPGTTTIPYSATINTGNSQGTVTFALASGSSLPAGLSLATSTGVISGTPGSAGTTNFTIDAIDTLSTGPMIGAKSFSLTIGSGGGGGGSTLTITPTSTPQPATTTVPFSQLITASGTVGGTFTWSIATGTLPGGLSLATSSTVTTTTISGTPNATGTFNFTVRVVNGASSGTQAMSIVVGSAAAPTYTITVTQASNGTIAPGTQSGLAGGSSQAFTITANSGFQIADVTVDGSSAGAVGTYTFTNILANHTITASFSAVSGGGGGGGSFGVGSGGAPTSTSTPTSTPSSGSGSTPTPTSTPAPTSTLIVLTSVTSTPGVIPPTPPVPALPTSTKQKNGFVFVVVNVLNAYNGVATPANFTVALKGTGASPSSFTGTAAGTLVGMKPGAYTASVSKAVAGYTTTLSPGCTGTTVAAQSVTCTIVATQLQPPLLTVYENVQNSYFGTSTAANFAVAVKGTSVSSSSFAGNAGGTLVSLAPGAYSVSEKAFGGYTITLGAGCSGTAAYGTAAVCTITATDPAIIHMIVTESVTNGFGGAKTPANFAIKVTGTTVSPASFAGNSAGTLVTMKPGAYSVSQTAVAGYSAVLSPACAGTAVGKQIINCSITTTQLAPPRLTVVENVINSYFGTSTAANFTVAVKGTTVSPASFVSSASGTLVSLAPGTYSVSEKAVGGYTITLGAGCSGTVTYGSAPVCTIIASDPPTSRLVVAENILNNYGGTKTASAFTISVAGTSVVPSSFVGNASGTLVTLKPGTYSISQKAVTGYGVTYSSGCSGTVVAGETILCDVITADFAGPHLTVIQKVLNTSFGTSTAATFAVAVKGTSVVPASFGGSVGGTLVALAPGSYSVSEKAINGYTITLGAGCSGTVTYGSAPVCTVTAQDPAQAHLTITENVVNAYGGTKTPANFTVAVKGTSVVPASSAGNAAGTLVTMKPGAYSVSVKAVTGYTITLSPSCTGTAAIGNAISCTITSSQIIPKGYVPPVTPPITPTSTLPISTSTPPVTTSTIPVLPPVTPSSTPTSTPPVTPTSTLPIATSTPPIATSTVPIVVPPSTPTSTPPATPTSTGPIDITIDDGGIVVTSTNVTITISPLPPGTINTSNEGGQDPSGWVQVPAGPYPWVLTPGQGVKTVTVSYQSEPGAVLAASTTASRSVFLDLGENILSQPALDCSSAEYLTGFAFAKHPTIADPAQVIKIQEFLNKFMATALPVTGIYDAATQAVVSQFQLQYNQEILQPWIPYGLPNPQTPTSNTYKTTQRWINILACPGLNLPQPMLP